MVVGKNIAVFGNDEARADSTRNRTLLLLAGRRSIALTRAGCAGRHEIRAEEPAEHIVGIVAVGTHGRIAHRPGFGRTNIDDRTFGLGDNLCRSEARSVGKEGVSACRSRGLPYP